MGYNNNSSWKKNNFSQNKTNPKNNDGSLFMLENSNIINLGSYKKGIKHGKKADLLEIDLNLLFSFQTTPKGYLSVLMYEKPENTNQQYGQPNNQANNQNEWR